MQAHLLRVVLFLALVPSIALAREAREQSRIDYLLHRVESAHGIAFIRNGSNYDGPAAAKHLRMKLNYGGERLKTAEDFIKYCATESSFTHRKYQVRTAGGATTEAAAYFTALLREFDTSKNAERHD